MPWAGHRLVKTGFLDIGYTAWRVFLSRMARGAAAAALRWQGRRFAFFKF